MNLLFEWFKRYKSRRATPKYFGKIFFVEAISEIPDEIGRNVYIVRRGSRDIWAVFMCPCENQHRLTVNLSSNRHPYWRAKSKAKHFSLYPSVWLKEDCYSHFWIDDHRIYWANI